MPSANSKTVFLLLIFLFGAGCGLENNPSSGHDPNKPLPVLISNNAEVMVDHTQGAIITTPDGKATLSISQTALSADTYFEIKPYTLNPQYGPTFQVGSLYSFFPVDVPTLKEGQVLKVTLLYESSLFPVKEPRLKSPSAPLVVETDVRLARFQDNNADFTFRCWQGLYLDAPSIIVGQKLHSVSSRDTVQLGIFGITSIYSYICPYNFIYPPF
jgi:hypothetical protein